MNYLDPSFTKADIGQVSVLGLAHVGDGVYELMVRTWLLAHAHTASPELHRLTVGLVNAPAQAARFAAIADLLTEEELSVFRRGRNAKVHQIPHHASTAQYHVATGVEALFGWLYLSGKQQRINELFERMMENA